MKNHSNSFAYRKLRTNIEYRNQETKVQSVCLTSANHGAGITTVASNLAIVSAANNPKVLLIDADINKPQIHKSFNIKNDTGFTNLLKNQDYSNIDYYTKKFKDSHSNGILYVMTSGVRVNNSLDLLSSAVFDEFMQAMKKEFDFIVLDCPSMESSQDVIPITHVVDGTIVVVSSLETNKNDAKDALMQLHRNGAHILGTVLNKVEAE